MDEIHGKREDGTVQIRVDGDLTGKTADSIVADIWKQRSMETLEHLMTE